VHHTVRTVAYLGAMARLRALTEEECYLRCYGWVGRGEDAIRLIDPREEHVEGSAVLTDRIRRAFEAALEEQEAEAA